VLSAAFFVIDTHIEYREREYLVEYFTDSSKKKGEINLIKTIHSRRIEMLDQPYNKYIDRLWQHRKKKVTF
jgi:hypothetical protein